jgi:hypothetical protein
MRSWKYRMTPDSALGIEIVSTASQAVLNSTTYVPSSFGPKDHDAVLGRAVE